METTATQRFLANPFDFVDHLDLSFRGFQLNLFQSDEKIRNSLFYVLFLPPLIAWLLMGADSTFDQLSNFVLGLPSLVLGHISFSQLVDASIVKWYGLGTHWSAPVIYSLFFIGISKHLRDELGVKNSRNIMVTTGFVGLAIAAFEFSWLGSYYMFQGQHWVLSLAWPQLGIIERNILFALPGILILADILWYNEYALNLEKKTVFLLASTLGLWLLWIYYPLPVQQLSVGSWTSTQFFPQTMYMVQTNPNIAAGEIFYVPDQAVHFLNNAAKIVMGLAFYSLFKLKKR